MARLVDIGPLVLEKKLEAAGGQTDAKQQVMKRSSAECIAQFSY